MTVISLPTVPNRIGSFEGASANHYLDMLDHRYGTGTRDKINELRKKFLTNHPNYPEFCKRVTLSKQNNTPLVKEDQEYLETLAQYVRQTQRLQAQHVALHSELCSAIRNRNTK